MRLRITREYFLIFPTSLTLYDILGGVGAALGGGFFYGITIALAGGVGAGCGG